MLRKLRYAGSHNLLPLVVIFYIAIGMPLVHPFFHDHIDHDHISQCHCAEHLREKFCEDDYHECPICNFLATITLHIAELPPSIIGQGQLGNIDYAYQSLQIKTGLKPIEPRAPPCSTKIS